MQVEDYLNAMKESSNIYKVSNIDFTRYNIGSKYCSQSQLNQDNLLGISKDHEYHVSMLKNVSEFLTEKFKDLNIQELRDYIAEFYIFGLKNFKLEEQCTINAVVHLETPADDDARMLGGFSYTEDGATQEVMGFIKNNLFIDAWTNENYSLSQVYVKEVNVGTYFVRTLNFE
jgi:hypothetical protein